MGDKKDESWNCGLSFLEVWDIEGVITLENGSKVNIQYEYKYKGYPNHLDHIQYELKARLQEMADELEEENITFTAKKRKTKRAEQTFVEHEANLEPEPMPVALPGDLPNYNCDKPDYFDMFDYGRGDM